MPCLREGEAQRERDREGRERERQREKEREREREIQRQREREGNMSSDLSVVEPVNPDTAAVDTAARDTAVGYMPRSGVLSLDRKSVV